ERRSSHSKPAAGGEAPRRNEGASEPSEPLLWINLGKSDGLDAAGLTAAVESAGAALGKVRRGSVRATYSYLAVTEEDAAGFEALTGRMHGEKALRVERAKKRR